MLLGVTCSKTTMHCDYLAAAVHSQRITIKLQMGNQSVSHILNNMLKTVHQIKKYIASSRKKKHFPNSINPSNSALLWRDNYWNWRVPNVEMLFRIDAKCFR